MTLILHHYFMGNQGLPTWKMITKIMCEVGVVYMRGCMVVGSLLPSIIWVVKRIKNLTLSWPWPWPKLQSSSPSQFTSIKIIKNCNPDRSVKDKWSSKCCSREGWTHVWFWASTCLGMVREKDKGEEEPPGEAKLCDKSIYFFLDHILLRNKGSRT